MFSSIRLLPCSFQLLLFLLLLCSPSLSNAMDLYFYNENVDITGGANHVIKGQDPADKLYTSTIICDLDAGESLPKTTQLTTSLQRSESTVASDLHTFDATAWTYSSTLDAYYISLKTGTPPRVSDYRFSMPAPGAGTDQLSTDSYYLSLYVNAGQGETNTKNNSVNSQPFDYTVYSGRLIYNGTLHTVTFLTPSTSSLCSGNAYFSSVSGDWDAAWWAANFARSGLCTNSSANTDGYSTDLKVVRDISLETAPTLGGYPWSIKGQDAATLTLENMEIHCTGSPPATFTVDTSVQSSVVVADHEIAHCSRVITPDWQENTTGGYYYFQVASISCNLPEDGPGIDDLQTGDHAFVSTITAAGDTSTGDDHSSTSFCYTVYSGLFYFNEVQTTFTTISFNPSWWTCYDGTSHHIPLNAVIGTWNDIFGTAVMNGGTDLCVDVRDAPNPDGYSRDLQLFSGQIDFAPITAPIAGLDVEFHTITLNENGGTLESATVALPDDITVHEETGGEISPAGDTAIRFAGGTFSRTMDSLILLPYSAPYFHTYGMPFYIDCIGMCFPLGGQGIELVDPAPVYVHQESIHGLAVTDPRRLQDSFPSNDIIFRYPAAGADNIITFDGNGCCAKIFTVRRSEAGLRQGPLSGMPP